MQKKSTCLAFALLAAFLAPAQEIAEKLFGRSETADEFPNHILATSDGGILVAGSSDAPGSQGYNDIFLLKTDSTGAVQWQQHLGSTGNDMAAHVAEAPKSQGGGYAVCGLLDNREGVIIRTDAEGRELWRQTFALSERTFVHHIAVDAGGDWLFCGLYRDQDHEDRFFWGKARANGQIDFVHADGPPSNIGVSIAPIGTDQAVLVVPASPHEYKNTEIWHIKLPEQVLSTHTFALYSPYSKDNYLQYDTLGNAYFFGHKKDSTLIVLKFLPTMQVYQELSLGSWSGFSNVFAKVMPDGSARVLANWAKSASNDLLLRFFDWKIGPDFQIASVDTIDSSLKPDNFFAISRAMTNMGDLVSSDVWIANCEHYDIEIQKSRRHGDRWLTEFKQHYGEHALPNFEILQHTGQNMAGHYFAFFERTDKCHKTELRAIVATADGELLHETNVANWASGEPEKQLNIQYSAPTSDGGLLCLALGLGRHFLVKIGVRGQLEWQREIGQLGSYGPFLTLGRRLDGLFYLLETPFPLSGNPQRLLFFDERGDLQGIRILSQLKSVSAICATRAGGFAIAGESNETGALLLLVLNPNAEEVNRGLIHPNASFVGIDTKPLLAQISSGGFVLVGSELVLKISPELFLLADLDLKLGPFVSPKVEEICGNLVLNVLRYGVFEDLFLIGMGDFKLKKQASVWVLGPNDPALKDFAPGYTLRHWGQKATTTSWDIQFLKVAFPPTPSHVHAPENQLEIQPNPSPGAFCVRFDSDETGRVEIELFAADGPARRFFHFEKPEKGVFQQTVLPGDLQTGLYFVRARLGGAIWTGRFLKSGR